MYFGDGIDDFRKIEWGIKQAIDPMFKIQEATKPLYENVIKVPSFHLGALEMAKSATSFSYDPLDLGGLAKYHMQVDLGEIGLGIHPKNFNFGALETFNQYLGTNSALEKVFRSDEEKLNQIEISREAEQEIINVLPDEILVTEIENFADIDKKSNSGQYNNTEESSDSIKEFTKKEIASSSTTAEKIAILKDVTAIVCNIGRLTIILAASGLAPNLEMAILEIDRIIGEIFLQNN